MSANPSAGPVIPAPAARVIPLSRRLRLMLRRSRTSEARFAPWILLAALILGPAVALESWQFVGLFIFVTSAGALYSRWPTAGIAVLVVLWTSAPFFRRLLDWTLQEGGRGPDIMSLAPYLGTCVVGLIALKRQRPSTAVFAVLGVAWFGLLIGAPSGLKNPLPMTYGLFAYISGSLALILGYRDWKRGSLVMEKVLLVLMPAIAAYGIYQWISPILPPWDKFWMDTVKLVSVGKKETGTFRSFSVLNSPATLATVSSLFLMLVLVAPKLTPWRIMAGVLALGALGLSQVRSAWIATAFAMLLLIPLSRGRALPRVGVVLLILGAMYVVVGGSAAGERVVDRASSITSTTSAQDGSLSARIKAVGDFGPQGVTSPIGHGIGSVSQAARISSQGPAPFEDNGYLLLLWQVGPLGFVCLFGAIWAAFIYGARNLNGYRQSERFPLVAVFAIIAVFLLAGDSLYGVTAVIFWYLLGALMASSEEDPKNGGPGQTPGPDLSRQPDPVDVTRLLPALPSAAAHGQGGNGRPLPAAPVVAHLRSP